MAPHAGVDWSALDTCGYVTASLDTDWYWSHLLFKYSSCWLQDRFYVWYSTYTTVRTSVSSLTVLSCSLSIERMPAPMQKRAQSSSPTTTVEEVSNASNVYIFPHLEKTGGTSLSFVLAMAMEVICGSAASSGWCWKPICEKNACMFNASMAWHENMVEFRDKYQFNRLAHVHRLAHQHGLTVSRSLQGAFAHEHPSVFRTMFPQGKFLLLFRWPDGHRVSLFNAQRSERWPAEANFSTWLRSDSYIHVRGAQLKWAHSALHADQTMTRTQLDALAFLPPATETAVALLERSDVAWVGILEQWDSSMCLLSRALGLTGHAFYSFARNIHTRWYPKDDPLNAMHTASTVSHDDYQRLMDLEALEWQFISLLGKDISNRISSEGPCSCDGAHDSTPAPAEG